VIEQEGTQMSWFYHPPGNDRLWLFAERGLMSYLFHSILPSDTSILFDDTRNLAGRTLAEEMGGRGSVHVLTEFDLGIVGFGCPDGGVLIDSGNGNRTFIFVEAKQVEYNKNFIKPQDWAWVDDQVRRGNMSAVREKIQGFNSSINGQLELKWRFRNAFRAKRTSTVVSEKNVQLHGDVIANDVFYLRCPNFPNPDPDPQRSETWREVNLASLPGFSRLLEKVDDFLLLAITADENMPQQGLKEIRLYDDLGQALKKDEAEKRIFWLPLRKIEARLTRLANGT
jgi:hypothetical protein